MQIPYLARHCRVLTFDGRGNGRSDRPATGYDEREFAADALAVMDATGNRARRPRLALAGCAARAAACGGAPGPGRRCRLHLPLRCRSANLSGPHGPPLGRGARHRRGLGEVQPPLLAPRLPRLPRVLLLADVHASRTRRSRSRTASAGASRRRRRRWSRRTRDGGSGRRRTHPRTCAHASRCPVLVIQGTEDAITGASRGIALAEATGGQLVLLEGSGTARTSATRSRSTCSCATSSRPRGRASRWTRGGSRRKRALYISSPIGLGHAQRDVAIADELRKLHPDLEIDWLAQHPVTAVLRRAASGSTRPARCSRTSRATSRASRPSTTCTLPGDPPDGRDPARELHGLPRSRPRRATTTSGSATRPGSSTTTCTRTPN